VRVDHPPNRWSCPICDNIGTIFSELETLIDHVKRNHEDVLPMDSIDTIGDWGAVKSYGLTSCPLCDSTGDLDDPELVKHILDHTHKFALRSLPWTNDELRAPNPVGTFGPSLPHLQHIEGWLSNITTPDDAEDGSSVRSDIPQLQLGRFDEHLSVPVQQPCGMNYFKDNPYFADAPDSLPDASTRTTISYILDGSSGALDLYGRIARKRIPSKFPGDPDFDFVPEGNGATYAPIYYTGSKGLARFQNEIFDLEQKKTQLEKQTDPRLARVIGRIAMRIQELKLKMDEAYLEAIIHSVDIDDAAKIEQTRCDLDKKRQELTMHQERMAKRAYVGPSRDFVPEGSLNKILTRRAIKEYLEHNLEDNFNSDTLLKYIYDGAKKLFAALLCIDVLNDTTRLEAIKLFQSQGITDDDLPVQSDVLDGLSLPSLGISNPWTRLHQTQWLFLAPTFRIATRDNAYHHLTENHPLPFIDYDEVELGKCRIHPRHLVDPNNPVCITACSGILSWLTSPKFDKDPSLVGLHQC